MRNQGGGVGRGVLLKKVAERKQRGGQRVKVAVEVNQMEGQFQEGMEASDGRGLAGPSKEITKKGEEIPGGQGLQLQEMEDAEEELGDIGSELLLHQQLRGDSLNHLSQCRAER